MHHLETDDFNIIWCIKSVTMISGSGYRGDLMCSKPMLTNIPVILFLFMPGAVLSDFDASF
jgi:hypothetical protein